MGSHDSSLCYRDISEFRLDGKILTSLCRLRSLHHANIILEITLLFLTNYQDSCNRVGRIFGIKIYIILLITMGQMGNICSLLPVFPLAKTINTHRVWPNSISFPCSFKNFMLFNSFIHLRKIGFKQNVTVKYIFIVTISQ